MHSAMENIIFHAFRLKFPFEDNCYCKWTSDVRDEGDILMQLQGCCCRCSCGNGNWAQLQLCQFERGSYFLGLVKRRPIEITVDLRYTTYPVNKYSICDVSYMRHDIVFPSNTVVLQVSTFTHSKCVSIYRMKNTNEQNFGLCRPN